MTDDLFGNARDDNWEEELQGHREAIGNAVLGIAEEREITDELLAAILIDLAIGAQTTGYFSSTEKPSVAGLRLELDRFRRTADEFTRGAKKGAEETLANLREALLAAEGGEAEE